VIAKSRRNAHPALNVGAAPHCRTNFVRSSRLAGSSLVAAMIVNFAWMGFLGYGFFKLVEPVFF
jgi:hypothetical protein